MAFVPARYSERIEVSADGELIALCDWQDSRLLRRAALADWPVPADG